MTRADVARRRGAYAAGVAAGDRVACLSSLVAALLVASCAEVHRVDVSLGPDDAVVMTGPPVADPPLVAFIPVGSTCLAVGFGTDVTPYDSALQFDHPFGARIQDATAYPSDCSDALIERRLDQLYTDTERAELRVSIAGHIEQTFPEDFRYPIWTGEIQYTEAWEGGRARLIVLDHVRGVPAD